MSRRPLVTLCMSTCSRPHLFPESLDGLLRQTYEPLEIIVLADGASPEALATLRAHADPRLRFLTTPQPSGMVAAWTRVCREAKGKYLLYCADDDVLCERAIDGQVELLEHHPEVAFCHADFAVIDDDGNERSRSISHRSWFIEPRAKAWARYLVRTGCCMQTTVVRRNLWEQVGGWDLDAGNPADNSLYLKLLRLGDEGHVPHLACRYRIRVKNPDSWERRFRNLRDDRALAMKHLPGAPARMKRKVMARLARTAIELRASAPGAELHDWLAAEVWPWSAFGRLCGLMDRARAIALLDGILKAETGARRIVKTRLLPCSNALSRI